MKKNTLDMFLQKVLNVPFWIKQVMFLKLSNEMKSHYCYEFLQNNEGNLFTTYVPILTFNGRMELEERKSGFDYNIYNFLQSCEDGLSIIEIASNTFLTMEEVAKIFEFCVEQTFVKTPEAKEISAMAGFIAGKFRLGEYYRRRGDLNVDELHNAIMTHENSTDKQFGEVLVNLGYVSENEMKTLLLLKEEAQKRFILDYNIVPKSGTAYSDESQQYKEEAEKLKEENKILKSKLVQLLAMVKKNANP